MITKYITQYLDPQKNPKNYSDSYLAAICAKIIYENQHLLGTRIINQSTFSSRTNIPVAKVKNLWIILQSVYRLIESKTKTGTYIIPQLSVEHTEKVKQLIKEALNPPYQVLMDKIMIQQAEPSFARLFRQKLKDYNNLTYSEQNQRMNNNLRLVIAEFLSRKLEHSYNHDEVFYIEDYLELMICCLKSFSSPNSGIVFLTPVAQVMYNAVLTAGRKPIFLQDIQFGNMMTELELLCKGSRKISVVYIGMTGPFPIFLEEENLDWERLHHLQSIYQFKILLDDRYANHFRCPDFRDIINANSGSILSIHRVSTYQSFLEVNVLAGSAEDIEKIETRFKDRPVLIAPSTAYVMMEILKHHINKNIDINGHPSLSSIISITKMSILSSGLFKTDPIVHQMGYIFYLKPVNGRFPRNIDSLLKEAAIHVVPSKLFIYGKHFKGGIIISVANYNVERTAERDLGKLYAILKRNTKI